MPGANTTRVTVIIDDGQANESIKRVNRGLDDMGKNAAKATATGSMGFKGFTVAVEQTNNAINQLAGALAGLAIVRLATQMFQTADALTKVQISFQSMTGSAQQAREIWTQLQQLAEKRPFALQDIAQGAQQLRMFGFAAKDVAKDMEAITGFGATRAWSTEQMDTVIRGLGMMREKGVAQARELFRQMAAQGIDVMQIIKDNEKAATGAILTDQDIRELMEKGRIAGEGMANALIAAMAKEAKAHPEAIQSIMGLVTTEIQKLGDEWSKLSQKIATDIGPSFKGFFDDIKKGMQWLADHPEARHEIEDWAGWAVKILAVATALAVVLKTLQSIYGVLKEIGALEVLKWLFTIDVQKTEAAITSVFTKISELVAPLLAAVPAGSILSVLSVLAAAGIIYETESERSAKAGQSRTSDQGMGRRPLIPLANLPLTTNWPKSFPLEPGDGKPKSLVTPNTEFIDQQIQESLAVLARAREENLQGIAAVEIRYDQLVQSMYDAAKKAHEAVPKQALANVAEARRTSIEHAIQESNDKIRELEYNATKQRYENEIALAKDAYSTEAELALAVVKDTPQAEAQAQANRFQIIQAGAEQVRQLQRSEADATYQYQANKVTELAQRQVMAMIGHRDAQAAIAKQADADLKELDRQRREEQSKADIEAAKETQKVIADIMKQAADQTSEHLKAARANEDNARIASAERQIDIARTAFENGEAQTSREKIDAIQKSMEFEIAAARHVQAVRDEIAKENLDQEKAYYETLAQAFPQQADRLRAVEAAAQAEYDSAHFAATQELADKETKLWLDAQKQINEAWIEGQKQIFDKIKGFMDNIVDAMFSKGKNIFKDLENMALGMAKDFAKAALAGPMAAGLMTAMGMPTTMVKPDMGPGAGQIFSLLAQQPKFGGAPQLSHLVLKDPSGETLKLVPNGGYPSIPVWLMNPPAPPQVNVTPGGVTVQGGAAPAQPGGVMPLPPNITFNVPPGASAPAAPGTTPSTWYSNLQYGGLYTGGSSMDAPMGGFSGGLAAPGSGGDWVTPMISGGGLPGEMPGVPSGGWSMPQLPSYGEQVFGGAPGVPSGGFGFPQLAGAFLGAGASSSGFGAGGIGGMVGMLTGGGSQQRPGGMMGMLSQFMNMGGTGTGGSRTSLLGNLFKAFQGMGAGPSLPVPPLAIPNYGYIPDTITSASDLPLNLAPTMQSTALNPGTSALAGSMGPLALMGGIMAMRGSFSMGQAMQNRNVSAPVRGITAGALGAFGGLLAAGGLAAMFPSLMVPLLAAGPFGWIAAAGIGAAVGLIGAFHQTQQQHIRQLVKQMYGIDISNLGVLNQIAQIVNSKYGGADDLGVASPEVQQLINLYAATQGMGAVGPRPMYAATYQQNSQGLQLQPVYSNGQVVANPYTGTTTTAWAMASQLKQNPQTAMYLQLDPATASALFQGQVVNVINQNPTVVGNANAASIVNGVNRNAQLGGLLEPFTV